jgi:cobalt-precorrin-7 (C5)-methyltransferase
MAHTVTIVGIGPGHPDYVPPIADRAIRAAEVLIGSKRALATFAHPSQIQVEITGKLSLIIEAIRRYYAVKRITVMVSGDPGFYSLVPYLQKHFSSEQLDIIPGLGSMQVAFCRAKTVWQDAQLLSLHGRQFESVQKLLDKPGKVGFLTDPEHTPAVIAKYLVDAGWPNCPVVLCEKISYPDERVVKTDLHAVLYELGFPHSVMVVIGSEE